MLLTCSLWVGQKTGNETFLFLIPKDFRTEGHCSEWYLATYRRIGTFYTNDDLYNPNPAIFPESILKSKRNNNTYTPANSTQTKNMGKNGQKRHPLEHFVAGGTAGLVESSCCHPLDTIKTRMQLRRQVPGNKTVGPIDTAVRIIKREGFMSLYKGLSAVYTGIVPKMVRTEDSCNLSIMIFHQGVLHRFILIQSSR